MTPKGAMIFAAGFGTRMMPLTKEKPKPMIHVAGRPLLDHALDHVRAVDAAPVAVNTHYKAQVVADHLAGSDITLIHEDEEILDTGGGLRNALPVLGQDPVWTINPDVIWAGPNPLAFAAQHWDASRMDALLVCVDPARAIGTQSKGDFSLGDNGKLQRAPGVLYGGAQIVKTSRLTDIPDNVFSLNRLWDILISEGTCFGVVHPGYWCDVGTPDGIPLAEELLQREI